MLISEFARTAGMTTDTVRFYVRLGLLQPELGRKGGSIPYQVFLPKHVEMARVIRMAQSLGFTLKEIASFNDEYRTDGMSPARRAAIMRERLKALDAKAAQLDAMRDYLRSKLAWMDGGEQGPEPALGEVEVCGLD